MDVILDEHLPWIRRLARRFHRNEREDCIQVGSLALVQCARRFDPSKGASLATFARQRVAGAMLDHIRCRGARVPLSQHLDIDRQELASPAQELPEDASEGATWYAVVYGWKRRMTAVRCRQCERLFAARVDLRRKRVYCSVECHGLAMRRKRECCEKCGRPWS